MSALPPSTFSGGQGKTPSTYSCDSSSDTGSTMKRFSEDFIEKSRAQQAQADSALSYVDSPPADLLADPDFNEGRRSRLIEEARRARLWMEEQQKEAVHKAREEMEAKISAPRETNNPEEGSKSKRERNRGKASRSSQSGNVATQQPANSQQQPVSGGPIQPDSGLQRQSNLRAVQPVPVVLSPTGENLHHTARCTGRRSRNPPVQVLARESQEPSNSPGSTFVLYGRDLQDSHFLLRAGPYNVRLEPAPLAPTWSQAHGTSDSLLSTASTASDAQTCLSPPSSLVPHSLSASCPVNAGAASSLVPGDEDIVRRGPPFFAPTRAAEAERQSQAQHTRHDLNLQQEIAWERDALWRILRQHFGVGDWQIRALLENEKNGRGDTEWTYL
ncbi:hypothetical protein AYL99_04577 [Fonsecaea erecta]|uniref:Uncharacterized protein n=1 Tax=Fonsecaea erecta TaxID=1367422 RepID=A0A178ZRA9_9EURO|nr:hypothetical protein AYL99_04577 [Fonsecaea erecta]OAP62374.1 hypothetical protein AYL99_04577 [Fonsecaea erecta]